MIAVVAVLLEGPAAARAQQPDVSEHWQSLVAAERRFARLAADSGVRAAFVATFAERSVIFRPGPVDGRAHYTAERAEGLSLAWEPDIAGVALTGDLGWTSGPSVLRLPGDTTPIHGTYLSVWQREPGEPWKVVLDDGVTHAGAAPRAVLLEPLWRKRGFRGRRLLERERLAARERFLAMERDVGRDAGLRGARGALKGKVALNVRLLEGGRPPRTGSDALPLFLASDGDLLSWTPEGGDVSAFDDLAYSWGTWRGDGDTAPRGHYIHVWQQEPALGWRIVAMLRVRDRQP